VHRNLRQMMCLFAATATVALVGLVVYSRGLLPIHPFWWQRPVVAPSSEDYAAYSGFVNDFFSSNHPFRADQSISPDDIVYIAAGTLPMKNTSDPILPLEVAAIAPEDMGQDFYRQNAKSWLLEARFRTDLKCDVVDNQMRRHAAISGSEELLEPSRTGAPGKRLPHASTAGLLQLSRIGLDHTRSHGIVYYVYMCGVLCGQSGWATLRKVRGAWKLDEMGGGVVY
jgi:hypothetical protein